MSLSLLEQVRRAGLPSLGLVGDEWMLYGPNVDGWTRRWRGRWRFGARLGELVVGVPTRLDLDGAARWLFNSRQLLSSARDAGLVMPAADVSPPGVDPSLFAPTEPGQWRWRLLYCGRADPRKGLATAIEALAQLPAEAELTIHGDGDDAFLRQLSALASTLGVRERVHFTHSEHDRVPEATRRPTPSCFQLPGGSRGDSRRWKRWRWVDPWSPAGPAVDPASTSRKAATACSSTPATRRGSRER